MISGKEWRDFHKHMNKFIFRLPQSLIKQNRNIAMVWMSKLKKNAPRFSGYLMRSISLRSRRGKKITTFYITVGAPHAYELLMGSFGTRFVHRNMIGYGGRPFGEWMDMKGFPRRMQTLRVGFPPTTFFGKYMDLWWEPTYKEMLSYIDTKFQGLSKEVEKQLKAL